MRSTILNRKGQMDRRLEIRTIVLVMIVTCVPALATVLLIDAAGRRAGCAHLA